MLLLFSILQPRGLFLRLGFTVVGIGWRRSRPNAQHSLLLPKRSCNLSVSLRWLKLFNRLTHLLGTLHTSRGQHYVTIWVVHFINKVKNRPLACNTVFYFQTMLPNASSTRVAIRAWILMQWNTINREKACDRQLLWTARDLHGSIPCVHGLFRIHTPWVREIWLTPDHHI